MTRIVQKRTVRHNQSLSLKTTLRKDVVPKDMLSLNVVRPKDGPRTRQ